HDASGLVAMQRQLTVLALQPDTDPLGHHERDHRQHEEQDPEDPGDQVQGDIEMGGDEVVRTGTDQHQEHAHVSDTQRGPGGRVPGPVHDVVLTGVLGDLALDERVQGQEREHQARDDHTRYQDVQRQREPADHHFPAAQQGPAGWSDGGDDGGLIAPVVPRRVDDHEGTHERQHAEHDDDEPTGIGRVDREEREAHHVLLGAARSRIVGVLATHHQEQVHGDQRQNDPRHQQDMDGEQPGHDVVTGELPPEDHEAQVGTDDRNGEHHAVGNTQTVTGEHIIGQGVAGEAGQQAHDQQREAHQPVQLTGTPEGAGEEDTQHVDGHRTHEDQGRPVVDLPHQQTATHVEG